jgi:hypothetical protein
MLNKYWIGLGVIALFLIAVWVFGDRKDNDSSHCNIETQALYIDQNGAVTDPIVKLLGLTGIRIQNDSLAAAPNWPEAKISLKSRQLAEVVPAIQGKIDSHSSWFGDSSKERWEKDPKKLTLSYEQAGLIIHICRAELGQEKQIVSQASPRGILFLGATLSTVRKRLAYLNAQYEAKNLSTTTPVYLLTGERKLDETIGETPLNLMKPQNGIIPFRNDWKTPADTPLEEGQMIKLVFNQSRHTALEEASIRYVYSPKGTGLRATRQTTIIQWLKEFSPLTGHYIAISSQPYIMYDESVIRRVLLQSGRPDICVSVVGPGMQAKAPTETESLHQALNLLNNLSRILYELLEIQKLPQR